MLETAESVDARIEVSGERRLTMLQPDVMRKLVRSTFIATTILVILVGTVWGIRFFTVLHQNQADAQATNDAITGFPLSGKLAPDVKLVDQFSQTVALSSLRGHEIVLAFIDARCTTLCPLTAEIMYNARAQLKSSEASQVMLVAINANPTATGVPVVQAWSIEHGMLYQWLFLTGTAKQLQSAYHLYNVYDQVSNGQAIHDPSMFIIDANGHERLFFETLNSNSKSDLSSEELGLVTGMQQWLPQHST
jgi:cytochrome oxidase Cu insertion factor (SCO1/SenC/PrrC family)